jgi:hypothetical protein
VRNVSGQVRYAIRSSATPITTRSSNACRAAARPTTRRNTRRSRFGDYALWFASKNYQHMANEPALQDAVVAPGARATARW